MLRVRALGYIEFNGLVTIASSDSADIPIQLKRLPAQLLDPVTVSESSLSPWLAEFEQRRRRGLGRYITPEQIRASFGSDIASLLAAKIGTVRVTADLRVLSLRGPNAFGGPCQAVVYWDGVRVPGGQLGDITFAFLAGVEYYTPSTVPVQYRSPVPRADGSVGCGVLLLWSGP